MPKLLSSPFSRGMGSYGKMHNAATIMSEDKEDEEQPECRGRNNKEVRGDHIRHVILQKRFPGL
jgi:hypothetical protein